MMPNPHAQTNDRLSNSALEAFVGALGQENFESLQSLANRFVELTPAIAVFKVELSVDGKTTLDPLAFPQILSENIQRWALEIGIRGCIKERPQIECCDSDPNLVMASQPMGEYTMVALFHVDSPNPKYLATLTQLFTREASRLDLTAENRQLNRVANETAEICELVMAVESADSFENACQVAVDEIASILTAKTQGALVHAYIATVTSNYHLRLKSVSGFLDKPQSTESNRLAEAAMRECLARRLETTFPPKDRARRHLLLCHQQFAENEKTPYLQSIRLIDNDNNTVAVLMISARATPAAPVQTWFSAIAKPLGATLALWERTQQSRLQSLIENVFKQGQDKKKLIAKVFVASAIALMIPIPHRVGCECTVTPKTRQTLATPVDGRLEKCLVEPGESVTRGQTLALFDDRELQLKKQEIEAKLFQAMRVRDGHVDRLEAGDSKLATLEVEQLQAERDLIQHQLNQLRIVSPIDGVIISGDLQEQEGGQFKYGQAFIDVAPLDVFDVELAIGEDDIRLVTETLRVNFQLNAIPFRQWQGSIKSIRPASEILEQENVFIANVEVSGTSVLKPGMRGTAKINTGWAPLGWALFRKPLARVGRLFGW